jgi:hypothetical protein
LYFGDEDQPVDPFIASAEGSGNAPAYRGTAYAMFEDFQLADYGNRIPSLTFEVEADPGLVSIGEIAEELSDGAVQARATPAVGGYAASGDSVRGAVEALSDVVPLSLTSDEDGLHMFVAAEPAIEIAMRDVGAGARGNSGRSEFVRRAAGAAAAEVTITYYEPARDYQTGLQRAFRPGAGMRTDRKALPAAISSGEAKAFAERRLASIAAGSRTAKLHLNWRWSSIRPGAVVRLEGEAGLWRVERLTLQAMVVSLELVRIAGQVFSTPSDPGRPVAEPDLRHGPTTVRLLDLPLYREELAQRPQLLVAAAGVEPGWRRADLMASYDAGASWQSVGTTAAPAIMGTAVTVLGAGGSALIDAVGTVEIQLLNETMWLETRDDDALMGGANLAQLGSELIQFGQVAPLGDGRFRLSRLLRGRMGTEWAADEHRTGEDFLLIDQAALMPLDSPLGSVGIEARLLAIGREESGEGVAAKRVIVGEALRPPAPVHLQVERCSNGDIALSWIRRSRIGWVWTGGSDTPLGEERETYRVTVAGEGVSRSAEIDKPHFLYSLADQITDGASRTIELQVVQVGTHGTSRAAAIRFDF